MVAYGCYVSPAWVSTEHVTHGSSAASNSAPHLPLFDLEVPSANPTITHQSTISSHPHPHQNSTWRSHRDDTRSAVGDVSPMLMTRSWYLTLGFAGFVPSPAQKKAETAPFPTSVMEMLGWSQVLFKASKPFTPRPWLWKENVRGGWISTSTCKNSLSFTLSKVFGKLQKPAKTTYQIYKICQIQRSR